MPPFPGGLGGQRGQKGIALWIILNRKHQSNRTVAWLGALSNTLLGVS